MTKTEHPLVVGAGVAGLAAAISLNMAGMRTTVYEARPAHVDAGASFVIRDHGQRVLERMGLLEQVNDHSMPLPTKYFTLGGASGREVLYSPTDPEADLAVGARCIDRSTFANILLAQARHQGVEIVYGKRLHTLEQTPDKVVVDFTDGTRAEGDVLIGADGRGSAIRSHIFPHTRLQHARGWNVYGRSHTHDLDPALATELKNGSSFMHVAGAMSCLAYRDAPHDRHQISWLLSGTAERKLPAKCFELRDRDALLEELVEGVRPHSSSFAEIMAASTRIAPTQVFHLPALPAWSQGRVALIGDAVHAADPLTGFGTTLSLEDGMYVAKMLREHHYIDAFYYLHADRHQATERINVGLGAQRNEQDVDYGAMNSYRFDVGWDRTDDRSVTALMGATTP